MNLDKLELKSKTHDQGALLPTGKYECGCCTTSYHVLQPGYYCVPVSSVVSYTTKDYMYIVVI